MLLLLVVLVRHEADVIHLSLNPDGASSIHQGAEMRRFSWRELSVTSALIQLWTRPPSIALTSSQQRRTGGGWGQAQQGLPPLVREPPDWLSGTLQLSCAPPELLWCRHPAAAPTSSSSALCPFSDLSDPENTYEKKKFTFWQQTKTTCNLKTAEPSWTTLLSPTKQETRVKLLPAIRSWWHHFLFL